MQKQDKQGKDVMWCFVEFDEVVQAARCMRVLQARAAVHPLTILYGQNHLGVNCLSGQDLAVC